MELIFDKLYMELAYKEAFRYMLLTYPNPSVGAVVLCNGRVVAIEAHKRAGTSHAEVLALLSAYEKISGKSIEFDRLNANKAHSFLLSLPKGFFNKCSIYVTLEPCSHSGKTPSCANLIANLGLKEVIIGSKDPIKSHSGGVEIVKKANIKIRYSSLDTSSLIEPFKIWQDRAFVVFKLAQTLNGVIGGGYISSKESLKHTHKLREVCSKMVIGGNTVRVDRPTLDCRFLDDTNAPDIYIYSKNSSFDRDIPLFNIKNRVVDIGDNLNFLNKPSLILIEGGEGMLNALKDRVDWLLIYQAPKISKESMSYYNNINLEYIEVCKNKIDIVIWSRVKK